MVVFPYTSLSQDSRPIVRLIYFIPSDRQAQPDIDEKMDRLIKGAQLFYAENMENHGFGRKTFEFETNRHGNAVVHHIRGKFNDAHYHKDSWIVWEEIEEQFDLSKNIYFTALDTSNELLSSFGSPSGEACGKGGSHGSSGGKALLPASGPCFALFVADHELGHSFGLRHDVRADGNWIATRSRVSRVDLMTTSFCSAEWLDVHRAFNPGEAASDEGDAIVEMLPPSLAAPPNTIRFRFEVTDPDGLHQARLLASGDLISFKRLDTKSSTVEFVMIGLPPKIDRISLAVMDVNGNFTFSQVFPVDIISLLPRPEIVSIPDPNLAEAVRQVIGNSITTHTILNLANFHGSNRGITDITGLEHAHSLIYLNLDGEFIKGEHANSNKILDISPLSGLIQLIGLSIRNTSISDISPLAELKRLSNLNLVSTDVSDISALSGLTQLKLLGLSDTSISDISPLAELKRLSNLSLIYTDVSDISALSGLTQLRYLGVAGTSISDISPLTELTQLTRLDLFDNAISDVSALAGLTQLTDLDISGNPLNYTSINTHIPAMQARGIEVKYDPRMPTTLVKISGTAQQGNVNTALALPFVVEVRDQQNRVFAGVPVTFTVVTGGGKLSVTTVTTDAAGRAQTTPILGPNLGPNEVRVTAAQTKDTVTFTAIAAEASRLATDVNGDGIVNIQDLVLVSSNFGKTGQNSADVNGDGIVNISDLVLVAGAFGEGAAAAPTLHLSDLEGLTAAEVQDLLTQARQMALTDTTYLRGIAVLEQLLTLLLPKETALLPNYPNPFNPETWIPYQLAAPAEVTLTIYAVNGQVVRTLALGHQPAGMYHSRSRAAYWDGQNEHGERVASGVYFYTLTAGGFAATRKIVIRK